MFILLAFSEQPCSWQSILDTTLCDKFVSDIYIYLRGRCGRDSTVVGFKTTYAISVYHH